MRMPYYDKSEICACIYTYSFCFLKCNVYVFSVKIWNHPDKVFFSYTRTLILDSDISTFSVIIGFSISGFVARVYIAIELGLPFSRYHKFKVSLIYLVIPIFSRADASYTSSILTTSLPLPSSYSSLSKKEIKEKLKSQKKIKKIK